jgi:hypothetical protein
MKSISKRSRNLQACFGIAVLLAVMSVLAMAAQRPNPELPRKAVTALFRAPYKYNRYLLTKTADPKSFESRFTTDPFVFYADGKFQMLYVGFDGTGYQTGLAESDDLLSWRRVGLILGRDLSSKYTRYQIALTSILRDDELTSRATLKKVNGRYLGTWHAYPEAGFESGAAVIGLAWSDNLRNWQIDEPILLPQQGAAWEKGGLYKSHLMKFGDLYYLFYNAKDKTLGEDQGIENLWHEQIGVATSRDLKVWTRYADNPIVPHGPPGAPDEQFAANPYVVRHGDTWGMYYYGLGRDLKARVLFASSPDPFHFVKSNTPITDLGPPGSVDDTRALKPSVISWGGDLYVFYIGSAGGFGDPAVVKRGITVARSRPWSDEELRKRD